MKIIFDTNVLSNLSADQNLRSRVIEIFKDHRNILCLSTLTISELMDGGNSNDVTKCLGEMHRLWNLVGDSRIRIFIGARESLIRELKSAGERNFFPTLPMKYVNELRKLLSGQTSLSEFTRPIRIMMETERSNKTLYHSQDKLFKKSVVEDKAIKKQLIEDEVLKFKGLGGYEDEYLFLESILSDLDTSLKVKKLMKIYRKPYGYIMMKALMDMLVFRRLCNALSSSPAHPELKYLAKVSRGHWYDVGIVASSCFADIFVTDDKALRYFCEHLRHRGIISFCTISSEDLLSADL